MAVCRFCDHSAPIGSKNCPSCGAELSCGVGDVDPFRLEAALLDLIDRGDDLGAIEFHRDVTGSNYAGAKAAVAALKTTRSRAAGRPSPDPGVDAALVKDVLDLLSRGKKVEAITTCSIRAGVGVEEARDIVEALAARPGRAPRRIGLAGMLLLGWAVLGFLTSLL